MTNVIFENHVRTPKGAIAYLRLMKARNGIMVYMSRRTVDLLGTVRYVDDWHVRRSQQWADRFLGACKVLERVPGPVEGSTATPKQVAVLEALAASEGVSVEEYLNQRKELAGAKPEQLWLTKGQVGKLIRLSEQA